MSDNIDIQKGNFQLAVSAGNHDEVARYISRGAANPAWKHGGLSALHCAARNGHVRTAELLLDYGWDLEAVDAGAGGWRPLNFAANEGHVQCR